MSDSDEEPVTVPLLQGAAHGPGAHLTDCLVLIHTTESTLLGKQFALQSSPQRIGRGSANQVDAGGEAVSRRHAHLERRGGRWWCVDDGSTNGTFVNDQRIHLPTPLVNGDLIKVGTSIFKFLSGEDVEAQYYSEVYRMTVIDALTQAHVKTYFLESLEQEIARARRYARPLSLLLFDLDHFKQINDLHGHLAGDCVLQQVARVAQAHIQREGLLARYGGEEFAVMLPETGTDGALRMAEALRMKVASALIIYANRNLAITISVGVATLTDHERNGTDLIRRADERMYVAKHSGRNRTVA